MSNNYGLAINNDVIARMVEMAALETEGVVAMSDRPVSVAALLGKKGATKSVTVSTENGIIDIELYVKVKDTVKVGDVAEKIQSGVKEKLQGMTGSAVTRVNVVISDIDFAEDTEQVSE
jgi:uncharacterized alkaline shock family protein YloU